VGNSSQGATPTAKKKKRGGEVSEPRGAEISLLERGRGIVKFTERVVET